MVVDFGRAGPMMPALGTIADFALRGRDGLAFD